MINVTLIEGKKMTLNHSAEELSVLGSVTIGSSRVC